MCERKSFETTQGNQNQQAFQYDLEAGINAIDFGKIERIMHHTLKQYEEVPMKFQKEAQRGTEYTFQTVLLDLLSSPVRELKNSDS